MNLLLAFGIIIIILILYFSIGAGLSGLYHRYTKNRGFLDPSTELDIFMITLFWPAAIIIILAGIIILFPARITYKLGRGKNELNRN